MTTAGVCACIYSNEVTKVAGKMVGQTAGPWMALRRWAGLSSSTSYFSWCEKGMKKVMEGTLIYIESRDKMILHKTVTSEVHLLQV